MILDLPSAQRVDNFTFHDFEEIVPLQCVDCHNIQLKNVNEWMTGMTLIENIIIIIYYYTICCPRLHLRKYFTYVVCY